MFWADQIAEDIKKRDKSLEWVDDMKTPSGRIHVGALRAILTHDFVFKSLQSLGVNSKFTYVFDNHDPMDGLPVYLDRNTYEKYMGMPLYQIPSPEEGANNFAEFYALEFQQVFNALGCTPEIIWATDLYLSGKMNDGIRKCLDNSEKIKSMYEEQYKKKIEGDMYPFNVYCPNCKKVSTTKVVGWDGKLVTYECRIDGVDWTKGCGERGQISPFPSEGQIHGKLPWKIEWAVKWQAIGVTVEGAGKDHMTKGGSHDLAQRVSEEILGYQTPFGFANEFFLVGGKKMSSSKGRGASARDIVDLLPPQIIRFLIAKTKLNQAINFDPSIGETIPKLFDEYQEYGNHYFEKIDDDYARIFEVSQIGEVEDVPKIPFKEIVQALQMVKHEKELDDSVEKWEKYARYYIDNYLPEHERLIVQKTLPEKAAELSSEQKEFLSMLSETIDLSKNPDEIQSDVFDQIKEKEIKPGLAFQAIYKAFLGNDHGPRAGVLFTSLDSTFVKERLEEASR